MRTKSLLIACAVLLVSACQPSGQWVEFKSQAGRFTVLMPATPVEDTTTQNTPAGPIEVHSFRVTQQSGSVIYLVAYEDYPADFIARTSADTLLQNASVSAVQNAQGVVLSEQSLKLDAYPGYEIVMQLPQDAGTASIRMYLVKGRLYQLIAAVPGASGTSPDIGKFLYSFKLTD